MQELVREYLNELGKKQKKHRRFRIVTAVFAVMVVAGVIWGLSRAGIATTGEPKCGKEDHQHTDECYSDALNCGQEEGGGHQHTEACWQEESVLVCGQEESEEHQHTEECYQPESVLVCGQEESEGHTHGEECYTKQLSCGKEEHQHEEECYIDKSADVEEESQWTAQYEDVEWKETWGEDLVIAAQLQLDYKESIENYTVAEDGSHKGYTRYGQFAGDPYTDWDASFVNFCMYYAGLASSEMFPEEMNTADWYNKFVEADGGNKIVYLTADKDYEPEAGDIVFFEKENEETETQMGIVSSYNKENQELKVIEGNSDNQVKENTYDVNDEHISEYLKITDMEEEYKGLDEEPEEATDGNEGEEGTETDANDAESDGDNEGTGENNKDELTEGNEKTDGEEVNEEVPEEATVELTTEVDGTVITLSGPESSFEKDKNYSIQAEKIEDEETIATIEEAIDKEVEKQEKQVKNYQAFDIKLLVDGEEVQPLGPVAVKFSGREVEKSVKDEDTEVNVIHVDENTGETTDMEATATDEKEVVIETEHFSVYVYVEFGGIEGIDINIQHWGESITTINSEFVGDNKGVEEEAFDVEAEHPEVVTKTNNWKLYSTDEGFHMPNETYMKISDLSKVNNANNKEGVSPGYEISKIWVSRDGETIKYGEDAEQWAEGTYDEYLASDIKDSERIELGQILRGEKTETLKNGSVVRFWYTPISGEVKEDVTFYDYDISDGVSNGKLLSDRKGINSDANYANNDKPRLGVGQVSSGNSSSWVTDSLSVDGKEWKLNAGNTNGAFTGLVDGVLQNGQLAFNNKINVPDNLFSHNPAGGSYQYNDYKLGFTKNGDTYTLSNVYHGENLTSGAVNLTKFKKRDNWNKTKYVFTNEFWPLDDVEHYDKQMRPNAPKDPLMGGTNQYSFYRPDKKENANTPGNDFTDAGTHNGNHNWYFGMTYTVDFEVGDYTGPMEYYFRGDDDFWLFLDGELVVDLGGIHTAIGTTFDLKTYMEEEVANPKKPEKNEAWMKGNHTLKVFYMERGATGSTCYMQFTLPKAEIEPVPEPSTTTYTVEKQWEDNENGFRPQDIEISLYKKKGTGEGVKVRTITLPLKNEDGRYVDQQGNVVEEPVWSYTWDDLPELDGKTGETIEYYAEEEYIAPENKDNPMLGYTYNKVVSQDGTYITLTNTIADKKVRVRKEWKDDDKELENRPDQVVFILYANGTEYKDHNGNRKTVTLSAANNWEGEFDHVPEYYYKKNEVSGTGTWEKVEYSVVEETTKSNGGFSVDNSGGDGITGGVIEGEAEEDVLETEEGESENTDEDVFGFADAGNDEESMAGIAMNRTSGSDRDEFVGKNDAKYEITIEEITTDADKAANYIACFKATNTLVTKNVCIEKVSKSDSTALLRGAVFNLYDKGEYDANREEAKVKGTYTTGENGRIDIRGLRFGEYYLLEIQAPSGFAILEKPIFLTVARDGVTVDFQIDKWENGGHVTLKGGKYYIEIPNEVMYELPSTGGPGIYLYMFGGLLLMTTATLITYRKKRRGVLRS